jgi:hypothetical protein
MNLIGVPLNSVATKIYQASVHGFSLSNFHLKVDGFFGSFLIIKNENGNIFGGFTSADWGAAQNGIQDPSSFIFTLINQNNLPCKLTRYDNPASGISSSNQFSIQSGPNNSFISFGVGYDIYIADQSVSNNKSFTNLGYSFQLPPGYVFPSDNLKIFLAGTNHFTPIEIEVYIFNGILINIPLNF